MPTISELDLSVFISLLARKIREMKIELEALQTPGRDLSAGQVDERCDLQEGLESYFNLLARLRDDHEEAIRSGIELPTFEDLTGEIGREI